MPSPGRPRRTDRAALYEAPGYRALLASLGANMRAARIARGWTLEQAAEQCGLRFAVYATTEYGQVNTTMLSLERIAAGLGVKPWELLVPRDTSAADREAEELALGATTRGQR